VWKQDIWVTPRNALCSSVLLKRHLSNTAHVQVRQVGSGPAQRTLNVGKNMCRECGSLKISISKMMEEIKYPRSTRRVRDWDGWDDILASITLCP